MDIYLLSDIIGIIGVFCIILAFYLLQVEKTTSSSLSYLYLNFVGALLLLISLLYNWNLASVIIEIMWLIISVYGIIRAKILKSTEEVPEE